jgi:hypothetical protein
MGRSKTLRYMVIALLVSAILLTTGTSMASSQKPLVAIVGRTGQTTMTGGGYALSFRVQDTAGASVSQPTILASGSGYQLVAPAQPVADGSGCCCKCRLPLILKK